MNKIKHIISIVLALGLIFLVLLVLDEAEKKVEKENKGHQENTNNALKLTTVIEVSPNPSQAIVESFAEVKAHWKTALKARKQGEVLTISSHLQEGMRVQQGEVLVTLDSRHYQTLIAESQHQIAQAELLLHAEKQQAKLAKTDWKLTRRKGSPSAFALRIPQIKAAQAQLNLAKASFNETRKTASYSKIVAPYNGIVTSRSVNLGEVVEAGHILAEIISSDRLDIKLMLDESQWTLLDDQWRGQEVDVHALNSHQRWSAIIEHDGGLIDSKTRQRLLHLRINSKNKPLAGSFVRIEILGKLVSNLLKIPASALTPDGRVWFVDGNNKLGRFRAEVVFSRDQSVFIHTPVYEARFTPTLTHKETATLTNTHFSIVVSPLSSYVPGLEVEPKKLTVNKSEKASSTKKVGR